MPTYTAPYYGFVDFFATREHDEVEALLDKTDTVPGFMDIYELANGSVSGLASVIQGEVGLTDFWTAVGNEAMMIATLGAPVDPDAPTLAEQRVIDGMLDRFYRLWPGNKRAVLDMVLRYVGENVENTKDPYRILAGILGASTAGVDFELYTLLAQYYITGAQNYIRIASRSYEFIGQVVDMPATKGPVTITCADENPGIDLVPIGRTTTNKAGYFRIDFVVLEGIQGAEYELQFTFSHPQLAAPVTESADYVVATPKEPVPFTLTFSALPSVSKTVASTGLTIPSDVVDYLSTINDYPLTHLEHIRHVGGFRNLPADQVDIENPVLLELDALAELEVLQDVVDKNKDLYDLGYKSISKIALTGRGQFMEDVSTLFEDLEAGRIHYQARAAHLYGINNAANALAPVPDHELGKARSIAATATGCNCPDCSSAVSPVAYLADLIGFATTHIRAGSTFIDIEFLEERFHHRLGGLKLSCDQVGKPVCQNRIAAESLRHFLDPEGDNAPVGDALEALEAAEKEYLMQAYELLLNKLGTSYTEIRSARGQTGTAIGKELAERLGIPEEFEAHSTVQKLYIDLSDPANIVEGESVTDPPSTGLETLFGLRDSNRDPLTDPDESLVERWKRSRLYEIWEQQDGFSYTFPGALGSWNAIVDPDVVTIDDLRYPVTGLDDDLSVAFDLWDVRRNWIDAEFSGLDEEVLRDVSEDPVEIPVQTVFREPRMIVAYGLEHLLDLEVDAEISYDPDTGPTIEYTVVDQYTANGNTYYHIQETPDDHAFGGALILPGIGSRANPARNVRSCAAMIDRLTGLETVAYSGGAIDPEWPVDPIDAVRTLLGAENEAQDEGLAAMALDRASARRLVELYDKNEADPQELDPEGGLTEEEWSEFKNILIMVLKRRACDGIWRTEETDLILGPQLFFRSINRPGQGHFPILGPDPLIDPDLIGTKDLPEVTAAHHQPSSGGPVYDLLEERRTQLIEDREDMLASASVQDLLDMAFNTPDLLWPPDGIADNGYLRLLGWLADPLEAQWANRFITDRLRVTEAELRTIAEFGVKFDAEAEIAAGERERVLAILQRVHKVLVRYSEWATEEDASAHWSLRKANIPKWRGTMEQRTAWLNALERNADAPIIDPDLIGPSELLNAVPGDRAYDLWEARSIQRDGWLVEVADGAGALGMLEDLNYLLKSNLGFVEGTIEDLRDASEAGVDIQPRLEQLNLTVQEFSQLMVFHDLLSSDPANNLKSNEKVVVHHILVRVKKRRWAAEYRIQECQSPGMPIITLSPLFFRVRGSGVVSYPPDQVYPIRPWLASEVDLASWKRKLAGRVEEEKSVISEWKEALFQVDESMMVHLRDALVRAAGDPQLSLIDNARTLGDQFLIDLENNCCYKTNRVAAAVETLQQLLWKTRTGDLQHLKDNLSFHGDFDPAWEWMGSYANWRAAMFVFLYPENVLHPSLRKFTTQAFADVVEGTRNNRRFAPADACHLADAYTDYLKDLGDLEVACGHQARAWKGKESSCGAAHLNPLPLTFLFAKARASNRLYYAIVDTNDASAVKQDQCWDSIPVPDGVNYIIHGCDRYLNVENGIDHIYLFVTDKRSTERNKFFALRYSLVDQQWEPGDPIDYEVKADECAVDLFETPQDQFDFLDEILALCVLKNTPEWQPPTIAITLRNNWNARLWTFRRMLNFKAEGLAEGQLWMTHGEMEFGGLLSGTVLDFWNYHPPGLSNWTDMIQFFVIRKDAADGGLSLLVRYKKVQSAANYVGFFYAIRLDKILITYSAENVENSMVGFWNDASGLRVRGFGLNVFTHPDGVATGLVSPDVLASPEARFISINPNNGGDGFAANIRVGVLQETVGNSSTRGIYIVNTITGTSDINWNQPLLQVQPRFLQAPRIVHSLTRAEQEVQRELNANEWELNAGPNDKLVVPSAEASYFVPMQIALQLHANGHYQAALDWFRSVYDYNQALPSTRKISHLLRQEEDLTLDATRMSDWYADPLNPHATAAIRPHTYTRYTLRAITSCLLDHADAEFTADTSESVPRARELYEDALDLLKYLKGDRDCPLDDVMDLLPAHEVPKEWMLVFQEALEKLETISGEQSFDDTVADIDDALGAAGTWGERLAAIRAIIDAALLAGPTDTLSSTLDYTSTMLAASAAAASVGVGTDTALTTLSQLTGRAYDSVMEEVTGRTLEYLADKELPWLGNDTAISPFEHGHERDYLTATLDSTRHGLGERAPAENFYLDDPFSAVYISGSLLAFCVVPNPVVNAFALKAEVELFKIRNCMNIAGMVRELDPFAAPTDSTTGIQVIGASGGTIAVPSQRTIPPSAYRYRFLVERARQLVGMAQQVEAAFLSALEKLDAERYAELRAEQDVATSKANIKLQDLKIKEAEDGVQLAQLQKERSTLQVNGLQGMINAGLLASELELINNYRVLQAIQLLEASMGILQTTLDASLAAAAAGGGVSAAAQIAVSSAIAAQISSLGALRYGAAVSSIATSTAINIGQIMAAFERRKQEWEFQLTLARKDEQIGDQQIKLANDRVRIVGQEREIAVIQNDHAKATLDFLRNKFTNADLYEWMSGVLEDVYAWFLQEATAVAIMAERQLIFERNVDFPSFIRSDYWIMDPNQLGSSLEGSATDRRGLTGSTRLLRDLTQLDQAAFSTNSPKRQLSKTLSLSEIAPEELIRLRTDGLASFYTTHDHFDRDYPGHYLRLIKKVAVTVIALTPPTKGIRATLSNGGASSVFTGGVLFQERVIRRYPDEIALSSGVGDQGVFQLQGEGEFLNPFEGCGVQTLWEFRMDKAANPFDFASIADVLITIEYEALSAPNRRTAMAARLNSEPAEAALAISLKNNLPDQWFDLHNTTQSVDPYLVSFNLNQRDLVPHVKDAKVSAVSLFVLMKDEEATFNGQLEVGRTRDDLGAVQPQDGIAPAGMFSGSGFIGEPIVGQWFFGVPLDSTAARTHFDNDEVDDVVLLVRYTGDGAKYNLS